MKWNKMIIFLRKAYSFIKAYWYIPVIIIGILFFAVVFNEKNYSLLNILSKRKEMHKREVEAIEKIHSEEIRKREEALEVYHKTIKSIEEKYEKDSLNLTNSKKKEIKKIVDETHDNPDLLAKKLANQMGFEIVYPKD